jgi:hypothetical protein
MRLRGTVRLTLSVKDLEDPCGSSTSGLEIYHKNAALPDASDAAR